MLLQNRYYNPEIGRFINADGQLNGGLLGYNQFAYCENNPVNNTDFSGKDLTAIAGQLKNNPILYDALLVGGGGAISVLLIGQIICDLSDAGLKTLGQISGLIEELKRFMRPDGLYSVYVLYDEGEVIQYVGRTKDPITREKQHKHSLFRSHLDFKTVATGLGYEEARILEQYMMLYCHTINKDIAENNQINGISPKNKWLKKYIMAGRAMEFIVNEIENEIRAWLDH